MSLKRKSLISTLIVTSMLLLSMIAAPVMGEMVPYPSPRLDEIWYQVISDPDASTQAFIDCTIDFNPDMIRWPNVQRIIDEVPGATLTMSPGFHSCQLHINCRDYTPSEPEITPDPYRPVHSSLAPLNWTDFRVALAWCFGVDKKEVAIEEIYGGPINRATYVIGVPPSQAYYYNPDVEDYTPSSYDNANASLHASGFYIIDDILYQPNGVPVRPEIEVISPIEAPTSVALVQKVVDAWNEFFGTFLGVTNCAFVHNAILFNTEIWRMFYYRDHDIAFICYGYGRLPTNLYYSYYSANDYPWGDNESGLVDYDLDPLLEITFFSIDTAEIREAAFEAEEMLAGLYPWMPLYSRQYTNVFKPGLVNVINSFGYGSDNMWTWRLIHWDGQPEGGAVNFVLGAPLQNLNPGWATSAYEWDVLDMCMDGLIDYNPETHEDIPWIACDWEVLYWEWEPLGIDDGMRITFRIRDDVYWQDTGATQVSTGETMSYPVTAHDIKFSLEYLRDKRIPGYWSSIQHIVYVETEGDHVVSIYFDTPAIWLLYSVAGLGLMYPKHLWEGVADPSAVEDPSTLTYQEWTAAYGSDGECLPPEKYPFMKGIVNCGPYVFDYWNPATNIAHVVKYQDFWCDCPIKQNFYSVMVPRAEPPPPYEYEKWRVEPGEDYTYYVGILNQGAKNLASELINVTIDHIDVYIDGVYAHTIDGFVLPPYGHQELGPYTTHWDTRGWHNITCYTYEIEETTVELIECATYTQYVPVSHTTDTNIDFKVTIKDIALASRAFGSYPGHPRWDPDSDVDHDYEIRIRDIAKIAMKFGW